MDLAAVPLGATERIVVGNGILPAPVRNAAFAAMELATLARLYPGRLHAGIGHGIAEWMRQAGAKPASQLTLLEEMTVAVRLSRRCADGTVLDTSARPAGVAAARTAIDEGRSEAGRTDPHRLTVFAEPGADPDAYAAAGADCLVFVSPDEDAPLDLTRVFGAR